MEGTKLDDGLDIISSLDSSGFSPEESFFFLPRSLLPIFTVLVSLEPDESALDAPRIAGSAIVYLLI